TKVEVQRAIEARRQQGSVLEYGLKWHLERFTSAVAFTERLSNRVKLKEGIPNEPRFPERRDEYINNRVKELGLLIQCLEDFKQRFSEYEEALPVISEVEASFLLYNQVVVAAKAKVEIQRAIEARREQGSVLEYGVKWHLEKFVNAVICSSGYCF